jgi:hypothetical protein
MAFDNNYSIGIGPILGQMNGALTLGNQQWCTGNYYYQTNTIPQYQIPTPQVVYIPVPQQEQEKSSKGVEMKGLYEVILCYGEDRKNVYVVYAPNKSVIAESDEDAKIKSGVYSLVKEEWDPDYLTILVRKIGDVKIKEKPKEVKNV